MAYCEETDIIRLVGDLPLPSGDILTPTAFMQDAADEIDSAIGFRYFTPVDVDALEKPDQRPIKLILKRINAWLAAGRLLEAVDQAGEGGRVHNYAYKLITDATAALCSIAEGKTILDIPTAGEDPDEDQISGPLIANVDDHSMVESFYNRTPAEPPYVSGRYPVGGFEHRWPM